MTRPALPLTEANAWHAQDVAERDGYCHPLDDAMIAEICEAAKTALATGRPHHEWRKAEFALPRTAPMLARAHTDIEDGRGFAFITGWPVDTCTYEENVAAYAVIASHLGDIVIQNYEGDWVVDVRNDQKPYSHTSRGYQSNALLPFHTDGADLSGLMGLGVAARGGETVLVSATAAYNAVAEERPDLLPTLERGFFHHRRRQHPEGENPLSAHRIPVFAFHDGLLHCCYNRNPIEWVRHEGMTLGDDEIEALDAFDAMLAHPAMQARLNIAKGDMLFFNNFVVLHSRTEFEDDAVHRRHLVRLWLQDPASKRLGESLLDLYVPGTSRFNAAE